MSKKHFAEVGKNFPSLPMLEKIAAALEIDALDLFDKTGLITIDKKSLENDIISKISKTIKDSFEKYSLAEYHH